MISVGILGGSGYTGKKLLQYCFNHNFIGEYTVYGFSTAGMSLISVFPELLGVIPDQNIEDINNISYSHDVYFIALPHGEALNYVPGLIAQGKKVIDLGGDYRLDSSSEYLNWYGIEHTSPALLQNKIYGLADYKNTSYDDCSLIANPGCYPTASLLSLLPAVEYFKENIVSVSVSAYSGTSGAGKSPKVDLLMSEMDGSAAAYNVNKHRHQPEIVQQLSKSGFNAPFSFTAHLLPVAVGIYATSCIHLHAPAHQSGLSEYYESFYNSNPFVRLRSVPPRLTWAVNTNYCDINVSVKDKVVIITAAIDNLIKGASGQAVQNLNKVFGWNETTGILAKGAKDVSVY